MSVETSKFSVHFSLSVCMCSGSQEFYHLLQATVRHVLAARRGPLGFLKIHTSQNGCTSLDLIFVEIIGDYLIKFTFEGYFGPIVSLGDY